MVKTGKKIGVVPQTRSPIVVVLGHVDHGKTSLLDKIRQSNLAGAEAGGITQHIGAYQVKNITFIDTPGHAAFAEMRSRGARVADLAILVVAVDEGVKPQTLESLKYIQETKINYLVALNKIDLPGINLEKAKKSLVGNGILVEGYGGDIVVVPVSAKTGQGIDELLEMITLLAQMAQIQGKPEAKLEAVVIESKQDSRRGPVATVIIRNGSLSLGDALSAGETLGKVKAMVDDQGKMVKIALPSQPVEVLGFKSAPAVGSQVKRFEGKISPSFLAAPKPVLAEKVAEAAPETEGKKLLVILKADTVGTLEAIESGLPKLCQLISVSVGDVLESDVLLARATGAEIIAFNVKVSGSVKKLAEQESIKISSFKIIYELFETIEKKIKRLLGPDVDEEILGRAEIIAEFKIKNDRIAGAKIKEGKINRQNPIHLVRDKKTIGTGRLKSMRQGKTDVQEATMGEEFGAVFAPSLDFTVGDMLVSFRKALNPDATI